MASDQTMTEQEMIRKLENFDYVRFSLCDINGMYRGQTVVARHVPSFMKKGIGMYEGILVAGPRTELVFLEHEKNYNGGSVNAVPDPETFRPIPWAVGGVKVAEVLCETRWKGDNSPQLACPRYVARQQIRRLDDLGIKLLSGFEVEFKVFDKNTMNPVFDGNDGYSQRNTNKCGQLLADFNKNLVESNVDVERYHAELGPGMFEAITKAKHGIESVDMTMNLKQAMIEIADLKDHVVTFMSRCDPERSMSGIGTHFNFSLWDESGSNIFYDASSSDNLSQIAKYWIAGIMKHSKALCAIMCPTVNCYRRLHQPFFPSTASWGLEDRMACLRIKAEGPEGTYFESRLPSGKSNLYLVVAATIAAGLDGVEKKMECPQPGNSEKSEKLPKSLSEALEELEADSDLVDSLGKEFVSWFVQCKRQGEIALYERIESDEERLTLEKEKYFM